MDILSSAQDGLVNFLNRDSTLAIEMSFAEAEAVLARAHDIASDKRTAFQARLNNIIRLGLPGRAGRGRGRAVVYGAGNLTALALAIELTQLGLAPSQATAILRDEWLDVLLGLTLALSGVSEENPVVMVIDPMAMSPLMKQPESSRHPTPRLRCIQSSFLGSALARSGVGRLAAVDLNHLLNALASYDDIDRHAFLGELDDWLASETGKASENGDDQKA